MKPNKYVIVFNHLFGESVVILPNELPHDTVHGEAISAGFFILGGGRVIVPEIGSTTLGIGPRPQDAAIIEGALSVMGIAMLP